MPVKLFEGGTGPGRSPRMRKSLSTSFWKRPDPVKTDSVPGVIGSRLTPGFRTDRTLLADAPVRSVFFLPDGKQFTAGWDNDIRTWDIGSGKVISDRTLEPGVMLAEANF